MSGTAVKVIQLFAALSLLIALHEGGHFFFARLFKTRVEKFYLFFDFLFPFSGLLNFSLFKKKKGDTEYGIGWFPLGGYVKIAGMVDESMDKEQLARPPEPWEYRSKKPYQRLFIMLGGIIVNVLVAIILYVAVFAIYGEEYLPTQNAVNGYAMDSTAKVLGLRNGDMIVSVDNKPELRSGDIVPDIVFNEARTIQVTRNGVPVSIELKAGTLHSILTNEKGAFITPRMPFVVDDVDKGSPAAKMGFMHGDSIVAINGMPVKFYDEFDSVRRAAHGAPLTVQVIRSNKVADLTGVLALDQRPGMSRVVEFNKYFKTDVIKYNPIQAVGKGISFTYDKFKMYLSNFKLMFTSKEVKLNESMGGIISFGKIFPSEFDMREFLMLTAFISIILAFMNLLPIPGLDGGYVIFLLFEMITGKAVSEKVMERATTVGLVLLLTLMVYANGLDIFRLFKH